MTDEHGKSSFSHLVDLVKLLSSIKGDLAHITIPPFFLAPCSVVENPSSWAQYPSVFSAPAGEPDPQKRILLVLELFLVALRSELYVAGAPNVSIKKPLNAFLGELFLASWTDARNRATTRLIVEQVSHHPPITAVHIADTKNGMRADGYARVEMTWKGSLNIRRIGHSIIHIDQYNEDFLMPFPDVQVRGFLSGCLYPEIIGTYNIVSSGGYAAEMKFSGQGLLGGGKKNSFEARVYNEESSDIIYEVSGVWSDSWHVKDMRTGEILKMYDTAAGGKQPISMDIPPVDNQDQWESRRAWRDVIDALERGDLRNASTSKHKLEEAQRAIRSREKEHREDWKPLFFDCIDGDEHHVFHRLSKGTKWRLSDAMTKGVWRVKRDIHDLHKPYRGDATPLG